MPPSRQKFPRAVRISHPQEFHLLLNRPAVKSTPEIAIKQRKNTTGSARLGIVIPKKKFLLLWKETP